MSKHGRIHYTFLNILAGAGGQVVETLLSFVMRTVFIYCLSEEFLGINGLFKSVLGILSMTELGFTSVAAISLYKPLSEKNEEKILAYINYYRKIFIIIAFVTFMLGMMLYPFLDIIIDAEQNISDIRNYYIFFLLDSAISYIATEKYVLLKANQTEYESTRIMVMVDVVMKLFQIIVLVITHNYYLYLILMVLNTLFINVAKNQRTKQMFPFLRENKTVGLTVQEKKAVWENTKNVFVYKLGSLLVSNMENILISIFSTISMVGLISNYTLLTDLVKKLLKMLYTAVYNSVGHLNHEAKNEHKRKIFDLYVFIFAFLLSLMLSVIVVLSKSFISLWLGEKYILDNFLIVLLCVNSYLYMSLLPVNTFRVTAGLVKEARYLSLYSAGVCLVLGIVFGNIMGIKGVFLAQIIARITTMSWYEPWIVLTKLFKTRVFEYYAKQLWYMLGLFINIILQNAIFKRIGISNWFEFMVSVLMSCLLSATCFFVMNIRMKELGLLKVVFIDKIKKIKNR